MASVNTATPLAEATRLSNLVIRFIGERLVVTPDSRGTAARRWRPNWWKPWQVELGLLWFGGRRALGLDLKLNTVVWGLASFV